MPEKRSSSFSPFLPNAISRVAERHPQFWQQPELLGIGRSRADTSEPAIRTLSLRGFGGGDAPRLAPSHPGIPAIPQPHGGPSPELGLSRLQPHRFPTRISLHRGTAGKGNHRLRWQMQGGLLRLISVFSFQRKNTGVIPAERCPVERRLPATALPQQERGIQQRNLERTDRYLLAHSQGRESFWALFFLLGEEHAGSLGGFPGFRKG